MQLTGGFVKSDRSWMSLVGFCLVTVFGAALAFAVIVAGGSAALAGHQSPSEMQNDEPQDRAPAAKSPRLEPADMTTFSGLVTDSYCGARHLRHTRLTPTECAATCIRSGASFVLVDGDHRYHLNGAEQSLSKLLGTRASVTGTRQGDTIMVSSAGPGF
jgi:hypothetical protein